MKIEHATSRDRGELLAFLLGVFRAARPDHPPFEDIYPDLFLEDDDVLGRHAVIREGGRIVACVGTYLIPVQLGGRRIMTAGVGQVATDPAARGKGCMTALINHELDRCRDEGALVAWLGGRRDRYAHFGFDDAGLLYDYWLDVHSVRDIPRSRTVKHLDATAPNAISPEFFAISERMADTALVPIETLRLQMTRLGFKFEIWSSLPEGAAKPDAWAIIDAKNNRIEEWWGSAGGRLEIAHAYCAEHHSVRRTESPADVEMNRLLHNLSVHTSPSSRTIAVLNARGLLDALAPFVPADFVLPENAKPLDLPHLLFGPGRGTAELPFYVPTIFHV
ncbi:MAG: GNAT family N-acetyltransferase [Kiritimatiellae bacterium]|nr:GNAT family N-acetyltransferase [Kiritimatiellia bacterium]